MGAIRFSRPIETLYRFLCARCSRSIEPGEMFYYAHGDEELEGQKVCGDCMEELMEGNNG